MSMIDDIVSILRNANPDADPQAVQAQAEQMAASPSAASVMSRITGAATGLSSPVVSGLEDAAKGAGSLVNKALPNLPFLASAPQAPTSAAPTPPAPETAPETALTPSPAIPPTPTPKLAVSTPVEPPAQPQTPSTDLLPSTSDDNVRRQAELDAANKQARMAAIPAAIAGIGGAIGNAAQAFGVHPSTNAEEDILNRAQENLATNKAAIEQGISNDPNSEASKSARALVLQIAPQMANQPGFDRLSDQDIRNKLPLVDTIMKAKAAEEARKTASEQTKAIRDLSLGEKQSQFEDRAVNQGLARLASIRGDTSLARAEQQRDAAITAVNRIKEVAGRGETLNPIDYTDLLGQIYKARSGAAPGEQVLKDIRQPLGSAKFNAAWTFLTGKQAPATSRDIQDSLLNMATSMGKQADAFHEAYMAPHIVKPAGVSDEAWAPIKATARGLSFADATKTSAPSTPSALSGPARKTASGYTYTVGQ